MKINITNIEDIDGLSRVSAEMANGDIKKNICFFINPDAIKQEVLDKAKSIFNINDISEIEEKSNVKISLEKNINKQIII